LVKDQSIFLLVINSRICKDSKILFKEGPKFASQFSREVKSSSKAGTDTKCEGGQGKKKGEKTIPLSRALL